MKKVIAILACVFAVGIITYLISRTPVEMIEQTASYSDAAVDFNRQAVMYINGEDGVTVTIGEVPVNDFGYNFYISEDMKLMVPDTFLKSLCKCSVQIYDDGKVLVMKGDNELEFNIDSKEALINGFISLSLRSAVYEDESGTIFIPLDDIAEYLGYSVEYDVPNSRVKLSYLEGNTELPSVYDMRDYERTSEVRDQGRYGTCWAFASLGAFESTLLPGESLLFSTDHMTQCNSYNLGLDSGGEHTMSIAYLAAWQGPVLEEDDPYGDEMTDPTLKAVKHLEEAIVINEKDLETLKSAIFRYGGIETSLYLQLEYVDSYSPYYSGEKASYYYDGEDTPNHDIVIVGWDDDYSKANFTIKPEGDGAFICKNSWGEQFGEDGYFYVSYYDTSICNKSVVYTRIGNDDNYDHIYQSDLLGWIGQMGFGKEEAQFANVYKAGSDEELAAVSFYVTDKNTEFEVYYVGDFEDTSSFAYREFVVSGSMQYAGYYTVEFPEPIRLDDNQKFAVIVRIKTPGAVHPIAIEYNADERTENFDITDGEGYISLYGELWHSAENTQHCNVCLKAFTNKCDEKSDATATDAEEDTSEATSLDEEDD